MEDWEEELGRAIGEVQSELAKNERYYEELHADYEKLKAKVREYYATCDEIARLNKWVCDKATNVLWDTNNKLFKEIRELVK